TLVRQAWWTETAAGSERLHRGRRESTDSRGEGASHAAEQCALPAAVPRHAVDEPGRFAERVRDDAGREDVEHAPAVQLEVVRDQRAVAAPPEQLRAHQRATLRAGECADLVERR